MELAKPLGSRVYKRHRTMVREMKTILKKTAAEIVREAIEEKYARTI